MSDERLRELERRWRESGSIQDEVAYLHERVRAGELDQARLSLAVFLGSNAARLVLGDAGQDQPKPPKTGVKGFVRKGLAHWGPVVLLRAAIAAARLVVADDDEDLPEEVGRVHVHLAEEYAVEPSPSVIRQLRALPRYPRPASKRWHPAWSACYGCMSSLGAQESGGTHPAWKAKDTAESVAKAVGSETKVRAAIVAELIPWALGYGDPVRERVEARQRAAE